MVVECSETPAGDLRLIFDRLETTVQRYGNRGDEFLLSLRNCDCCKVSYTVKWIRYKAVRAEPVQYLKPLGPDYTSAYYPQLLFTCDSPRDRIDDPCSKSLKEEHIPIKLCGSRLLHAS